MGSDGEALNASKRSAMPSEPTSACIPPEPIKRSRRGHPSMRLDLMPTQISAVRCGRKRCVARNLTVCCVGRCCCRHLGTTQTTVLFDIDSQSCASDNGTISADGALHASVLPTACELIPLAQPAFSRLTACGASVRSHFQGRWGNLSASVSKQSGVRPPADMDVASRHASGVVCDLQQRRQSIACTPWVR